jgi:hypothetical protein
MPFFNQPVYHNIRQEPTCKITQGEHMLLCNQERPIDGHSFRLLCLNRTHLAQMRTRQTFTFFRPSLGTQTPHILKFTESQDFQHLSSHRIWKSHWSTIDKIEHGQPSQHRINFSNRAFPGAPRPLHEWDNRILDQLDPSISLDVNLATLIQPRMCAISHHEELVMAAKSECEPEGETEELVTDRQSFPISSRH